MEYIEKSRRIPVVADADVIVAGGGPAGVCAAIASARKGAKTVLLEQSGCLGGTWTSGCLGWIIDYLNKDGLLSEIIGRLNLNRHAPPPRDGWSLPFSPENMKWILEGMCKEANVRTRLYTMLTDVAKNGKDSIDAVITESKSGPEAWRGKVFIDATGDGDLGALSGCQYAIGNQDSRVQPMSLLALLTGIDVKATAPYIRNYSPREDAVKLLAEELRAENINPSYGHVTLFHLCGDIFFLMSNHQFGMMGINADDLTEGTIAARREIREHFEALKRRGGIWKNIQLITTASHIGVREGRRLKGLYEVSLDDLRNGVRHEDAVCRPTFCIDVHAVNAACDAIESPPCEVKPYDIPLRALISADVNNLLMAGRCISGDFYAHASYRVTGNAATLGEAAGNCAAMAALSGKMPAEIPGLMFQDKYHLEKVI